MTDFNVARQAYLVAKSLGASDKVILALFEAGVVESNFTNHLTATDHDSLGYLQQRPSQGWPDPTNIAVATKSFVDKAKGLDAGNLGRSAGALAQAVQRSAFPDRYDQKESEARAILLQVQGDKGVQEGLKQLAQGKSIGDIIKDVLKLPFTAGAAVADKASDAIEGLSDVVKFFQALTKKETWIAAGYLIVGVGLIIFALFKLTGDNTVSDATKTVARVASAVATRRIPAGGGKAARLAKGASAVSTAKGLAKPNTSTASGGTKAIEAGAGVATRGKL